MTVAVNLADDPPPDEGLMQPLTQPQTPPLATPSVPPDGEEDFRAGLAALETARSKASLL